eukprot:TRINITY_DN23341_c0_g1_i1.p1 TRINITY_DN23341_c0_g1~~TRINITY_DN23341_c0_g1_i1.p1  ORF type:complete len:307 (+),score=32.16 TRINITY_DN23341_c0_g1_i1:53-973(+)
MKKFEESPEKGTLYFKHPKKTVGKSGWRPGRRIRAWIEGEQSCFVVDKQKEKGFVKTKSSWTMPMSGVEAIGATGLTKDDSLPFKDEGRIEYRYGPIGIRLKGGNKQWDLAARTTEERDAWLSWFLSFSKYMKKLGAMHCRPKDGKKKPFKKLDNSTDGDLLVVPLAHHQEHPHYPVNLKGADEGSERRQDTDGVWYTRDEFFCCYGTDDNWQAAAFALALAGSEAVLPYESIIRRRHLVTGTQSFRIPEPPAPPAASHSPVAHFEHPHPHYPRVHIYPASSFYKGYRSVEGAPSRRRVKGELLAF